jgi:transcriptional regulator with XRE-family HTH domain
MNREDILKRPAYWFEHEQNELFRQVSDYMERENINRTELAKRLKVHKSYVSQILNGNFNYTLKKWIELCLTIGIVPGEYRKLEDIIKADSEFANNKLKVRAERKANISPELNLFSSNSKEQLIHLTSTFGDAYSTKEHKYEDDKIMPFNQFGQQPPSKA